uniref:Uncharacterized protein n=1 Tax=Glossina palpalis gambiensis TaxID=67801 RepID=A0A1B0BFK0_9MUSC
MIPGRQLKICVPILLNLSCRKSETDFVVVIIIVMCQACCTNIQVSHDYLYNLLESQAKVHMFNETWQVRVLNWRLPHLLPRAFIKCIDKSPSNGLLLLYPAMLTIFTTIIAVFQYF